MTDLKLTDVITGKRIEDAPTPCGTCGKPIGAIAPAKMIEGVPHCLAHFAEYRA